MLSRLENEVLGQGAGLEALDGALMRSSDALWRRKNKRRPIIDLGSATPYYRAARGRRTSGGVPSTPWVSG